MEVHVEVKELDEIGMGVDFKVLKSKAKVIVDRLDHYYLNEVPPFDKINTTAENIACYIYKELSGALNDGNVKVSRIRVWESEKAAASYYE